MPSRCWSRFGSAGSGPRSRSWTWTTTSAPSTRGSRPGAATRSSAARDARCQGRQASSADLRAWRADLCGFRRQAPGGQVAVPHRRVLAGQHVGRGEPAAHPDPSGDGPLAEALPAAWRGRAGERPTQERMGTAAAAGPAHRAGRAARRPDHPGPAGDGAGQGPNLGDPYPPRTTTLGVAACLGPQQPAALSAGKDHADRCGAVILGPYPHLRTNHPKLAEELTMTRRLASSFASRIAGPS